MTTKLQQRYGEFEAFTDARAKQDITWCENTANELDRALLGMIERKVLTRDGAYAKQLRSIINKVRSERTILSEELLDHLEGVQASDGFNDSKAPETAAPKWMHDLHPVGTKLNEDGSMIIDDKLYAIALDELRKAHEELHKLKQSS